MSGQDLDPIDGVDTAISHRCTPIEPFRCWQFDKAAGAIPVWVLQFLTVQPTGLVEFNYPENGPSCTLEQGDWVILFDGEEDLVTVLPPEEFATRFRVVFQ